MGLFSWDCRRCGHSLLSPMATGSRNAWMSDVVVLDSDGELLSGTYDGYGRVDGTVMDFDGPAVWHRACWELDGEPTAYPGPSADAEDQGWFFDAADHDVEDPRGTAPGVTTIPPAPLRT